MENLIYILPLFGLVGLAYMAARAMWVNKQDAGEENMQKLAGYVKEGAMAFLKKYTNLSKLLTETNAAPKWVYRPSGGD